MQPLLRVEDLRTSFHTDEGTAKAVDGVSFVVAEQETLGIVGESGCGKSVTALSILRLIPDPPGRIEGGNVEFQGRDLLDLTEKEMRRIRGNEIAMIFQEPMTSLNPVYTVGEQISEVLRLHRGVTRAEAEERAVEMLRRVRIPDPEQRVEEYPHQLSGGQRQRVMIAMALACDPALLIADEPTTALDVTVQAQILDLLRELQNEFGMAIMLITHDLGVIAEMAHRVVVMYAGVVVESGTVEQIFDGPNHPYTEGLKAAIPKLGERVERLATIPGTVPSPYEEIVGCPFQNRCPYVMDVCRREFPRLYAVGAGHEARCFLYD
ncbi:MAG TPA: ABC transporter ATP-binding protein [Gemmatimonadota bacterium]|jgi:oligopeptide/dipeptide ABC transporter ATP-binding protein|nr:ABC transporter ATP-binding protein [Gemmatimonadota bacterium]